MDRQSASAIESGSTTTSDSTKAKYRPQQSCIKCRERKVKCDQAKPCRACCSRGLQDECEYTTNNEDRFQINQADIIENLRREVNRLKRRLADVEQSTNSPNGSATAGSETWPRKATAETTKFPVAYAQYDAAQHTIVDTVAVTSSTEVPSGVVSDSNYAKLFVPWTSDPVGTNPNSNSKMTFSDNSISPAQWPMANVAIGASYHGSTTIPAVFSPETTIPDTTGYGTSSNNHPPSPPVGNQNGASGWEVSTSNQRRQQQPTNPWKGRHELLERLFNVICDCDDALVDSVVEIIRTSASPEDAMALIDRTMSSSVEAGPRLGSTSSDIANLR